MQSYSTWTHFTFNVGNKTLQSCLSSGSLLFKSYPATNTRMNKFGERKSRNNPSWMNKVRCQCTLPRGSFIWLVGKEINQTRQTHLLVRAGTAHILYWIVIASHPYEICDTFWIDYCIQLCMCTYIHIIVKCIHLFKLRSQAQHDAAYSKSSNEF